jgi:hypothetical protein
MKYLRDYMEDRQTELFKKTGTFFAFSQKQFEEQRKENVKYVNMGQGMLTPDEHYKEVFKELDKIYNDSIKQDIKENGKDKIILRELHNHEAFYVGEIEDTIHKLEDYPFTEDDISHIYQKNYAEATKDW